MNKKIFTYLIAITLNLYSQHVLSNEVLPDTVLEISLNVVNITCDINNGKGFNKVVDFEVINETDLLAGKHPAVKTQFIVDCQKSGVKPDAINITFSPGYQGVFNYGLGGELKTSLSGVGIYLTWLDATPIDLSGSSKQLEADSNNQFDISFLAKPFAQSQNIEKGLMKSSVIIDMAYK